MFPHGGLPRLEPRDRQRAEERRTIVDTTTASEALIRLLRPQV